LARSFSSFSVISRHTSLSSSGKAWSGSDDLHPLRFTPDQAMQFLKDVRVPTEGRAERKHAHQARAATYAWVPQITLTGPIGLYPGGAMKVTPLAIENPAGNQENAMDGIKVRRSFCDAVMPPMSEMGPVSRVTPLHTAMRNCTRDEGRSFVAPG
jgi:hypothetical protein